MPGDRIGEHHLYGAIVVLVLVHQHDGPLPIRTLDGVSRHQSVPVLVFHVARDFVEFVCGIDGLYPFLGDNLRRQILRGITYDAVVLVYWQETAAATSALCCDVMEIVSAAGASGHHGTYIIGQPEGTLHAARSALSEVVALG